MLFFMALALAVAVAVVLALSLHKCHIWLVTGLIDQPTDLAINQELILAFRESGNCICLSFAE